MIQLQANAASMGSRIESKEVGNYICIRMGKVVTTAVALHKIAQFSVNHGGHLACAATTIVAGLGSLYRGDFLMGGTLTALGVKEAYQLLQSNQSEVQRLLEDAGAGIDMIKTLEQANQSSFEHVNVNLNSVTQSIEDLEGKLSAIKSVATRGSKKLERQKEKNLRLFQGAEELFKQSQAILNQSKTQIDTANNQFGGALQKIQVLVALAQEEKGDFQEKAKRFAELSKQIFDECGNAKGILEEGNCALNEGLTLLNNATRLFNLATFEAGKTTEMANAQLKEIELQALSETSCQDQLSAIKEELQEVQSRNQNILHIADVVQGDLEAAEQAAMNQFGYQSLILGGGTGAFLGAMFSGGTAASAGAVAGTVAYHNRESIGNYLFGKDPEPAPVLPSRQDPLTFEFNAKSSGLWGRFFEKRGSVTKGKVSLDLGDGDVVSFKFNLNDKHKIAKKDLYHLYRQLSAKLDQDPKYAASCLRLLDRLATTEINRGEKKKSAYGFISTNDPYFADLKSKAKKLLSKG